MNTKRCMLNESIFLFVLIMFIFFSKSSSLQKNTVAVIISQGFTIKHYPKKNIIIKCIKNEKKSVWLWVLRVKK